MNSMIRILKEESGRVSVSSAVPGVGNLVPISLQNWMYICNADKNKLYEMPAIINLELIGRIIKN
ncbi:MAG: hypothetical protein WBB67_07770 [bacterium]